MKAEEMLQEYKALMAEADYNWNESCWIAFHKRDMSLVDDEAGFRSIDLHWKIIILEGIIERNGEDK